MERQRNPKAMSSADKAALILLALGEDLAAQILNSMHREDVVQIAKALQKTERVEQNTLDQILADFHDLIQALHPLPLHSPAHFLSSLEKKLGPEVAAMLHQNLDWATPSLIATLEKTQAKPLASYLQREHPQTVAIIIAHLQPQKASQVLKLISEASRVDILQRLARLLPVAPETIADLEEVLKEALKESLSMGHQRLANSAQPLGGAQKVADLLSQLDRNAATQLLDQLKERDHKLFQEVQEKLFRFVDLVKIEAKDLPNILLAIPQKTLLLALKDCPPPVFETIKKAMSSRAWRQIQEDLAGMTPIRLNEVEKAQQDILKIVRQKIESGEIQVRDSTEIYV